MKKWFLTNILKNESDELSLFFYNSSSWDLELLDNSIIHDVYSYKGENWFWIWPFRQYDWQPEEEQISYDKMLELEEKGEAYKIWFALQS